MSDYMKFWPLVVVAAGAIASAATAQMQINSNNANIEDISESVDENEEGIEQIQRLLIQRQADVAIKLLGVENEQRSQGEDIDQILLLLQQQASQ
jgi:hypothetical protein